MLRMNWTGFKFTYPYSFSERYGREFEVVGMEDWRWLAVSRLPEPDFLLLTLEDMLRLEDYEVHPQPGSDSALIAGMDHS